MTKKTSKKTAKGRAPRLDKGKWGKPTDLTDEVRDSIMTYLRHGSYIETAVAAQGLSRNVFYVWMRRGRKAEPGDEIYVKFAEEVDKAIAEAEFKDILRIEKAASKTWQAAAWRLERRFPERWARKEQQTVTTENKVSFVTKIGADGVIYREKLKADDEQDSDTDGN